MRRLLGALAVLAALAVCVAASPSFSGDTLNVTGWVMIGPPTGQHWMLTPTGMQCIQSSGVPCVFSLQGSEGVSPPAGTGQSGFNSGADWLAHYGMNGKDLGAITVRRDWIGSLVNAYMSDVPLPKLMKDDQFCGDPLATNTGSATLNVNLTGPHPITKLGGQPLVAGDLRAGITACVDWNGASQFTLENPQ